MADLLEMTATIGSLTRFAAAIDAANLSTIFKGSGPFTLFAPSDDAYDEWQRQASPDLFHNLPRLTDILGYHVLPQLVMAADLMDLAAARTLQGQTLAIDSADGITIDGAHVIQADIEADNGVIHIIDMVLIPSMPPAI